MKGWRVPAVLLSVIVLLLIILGVKIMNNTPEKQLAELKNNYNSNVDNDIGNNTLTEDDKYLEIINKLNEQRENSYKEKKKQEERIEIISGIISVITVISYYIIYYKMGIRENFVKYIGISWGTVILLGILNLYIPMLIALIPLLLLNIVMITDIYKSVGVSPVLTLTFLVPFVGIIIGFMVTWKLGDYFGKGTGFKLGLIFLPFIFLPILAFTAEA